MHRNWREQSIGEIVATFPLSSEVFRSAGIDFCCGGRRLLGDVIEEQGIVETNPLLIPRLSRGAPEV